MTHRSPHVARLVEAMVDARLGGFLEFHGFAYRNSLDTGRDMDELAEALELLPCSSEKQQREVPATFEQFREKIYGLGKDAEDLLDRMFDARVEAGFLLGLELGRRLGGAR